MIHIVLLEPEIPANTGNIGRTCVATNTKLHLIEPLGFSLSEKALKRAGMDYWQQLDVATYVNYEDFLKKKSGREALFCDDKGTACLFGCAIYGRLLHRFRQGERGHPGGAFKGASRYLRADPHVRGEPLPQSVQFRGSRAL